MRKVEIICRPLETWPRDFTRERKRSPFKTGFEGTRRKLIAELRHLEAATVVVQVALPERDISVSTGWPRGDRSPTHRGVIVAADTKHGALKWVCDDCSKWTDNVHAIALTLERLRLADLYGVTRKGEQYAGWKMLPGPITATAGSAPGMSIEAAARWAAECVEGVPKPSIILGSRAAWEKAQRELAKLYHPDLNDGRITEGWKTFQEAAQLLNGLHSGKVAHA